MTDLFPPGRPENAMRAFLPLVVEGRNENEAGAYFSYYMQSADADRLALAYSTYLREKPWRSLLKHGISAWHPPKGSQNRVMLAVATELWRESAYDADARDILEMRNAHEDEFGLLDYEWGRMKGPWHVTCDHAILERLRRIGGGDDDDRTRDILEHRLKHIHGLLALHALPWPDAQGPRGRVGPSVHVAGNRSDRKTEGHIPLNDLFALAVSWPDHHLPSGWSKPLPNKPWNGFEWRTMEALGLNNVRRHLPADVQRVYREHVHDPANPDKFCFVVLACQGAKLAMPVHILREGLQLQVCSAIINHHSPGAFERMAWREDGQMHTAMEVAQKGRWTIEFDPPGLFIWRGDYKASIPALDNPYRHVVIDQKGIRTL